MHNWAFEDEAVKSFCLKIRHVERLISIKRSVSQEK